MNHPLKVSAIFCFCDRTGSVLLLYITTVREVTLRTYSSSSVVCRWICGYMVNEVLQQRIALLLRRSKGCGALDNENHAGISTRFFSDRTGSMMSVRAVNDRLLYIGVCRRDLRNYVMVYVLQQ